MIWFDVDFDEARDNWWIKNMPNCISIVDIPLKLLWQYKEYVWEY